MAEVIRFQLRRGTASEWAQINPVLASGEPGVETDTRLQKIGDGVTAWNALPYHGPTHILEIGTVETAPGGGVLDEEVAHQVLEGPATVAALSATYAGRAAAGMEVRTDFSRLPDGEFTKQETGQAVVIYPPIGHANAVMRPRVTNGKLTFSNPDNLGPAGGYASTQLSGPVKRIGASFTFSPYTTGNGVACIAVTTVEIGSSYTANQGVPQAPIHLTVGPTNWGLTAYPGGGGESTLIADGTFNPPLQANNTAIHSVDVVLDPDTGTAYITLPTGKVVVATHAMLKVKARWVFAEPFVWNAGGTDSVASFVSFWADSLQDLPQLEMKRAVAAATSTAPQSYAGHISDTATVALSTTVGPVKSNWTLAAVFPPSGKLLVEATFNVTGLTGQLLGRVNGFNPHTIAMSGQSGPVTMRAVITGAAGQAVTITPEAVLLSGAGNAQFGGAYGPPTISATPIA